MRILNSPSKQAFWATISTPPIHILGVLQCVAMYCSVLQCVVCVLRTTSPLPIHILKSHTSLCETTIRAQFTVRNDYKTFENFPTFVQCKKLERQHLQRLNHILKSLYLLCEMTLGADFEEFSILLQRCILSNTMCFHRLAKILKNQLYSRFKNIHTRKPIYIYIYMYIYIYIYVYVYKYTYIYTHTDIYI